MSQEFNQQDLQKELNELKQKIEQLQLSILSDEIHNEIPNEDTYSEKFIEYCTKCKSLFDSGKKSSNYLEIEESDFKYKGFISNDKFHGYGELKYNNGKQLLGNWFKGEFYTGSIVNFETKDKYYQYFKITGDVINKEFRKGIKECINDYTLEGEFSNGLLVKGIANKYKLTFEGMEYRYYGSMVNNKPLEGELYDYNNKLVFKGKFDNELFTGKASNYMIYWKDDNYYYTGDMVNTKPHGEGEIYYGVEPVLKGKFENGDILKGYANKFKVIWDKKGYKYIGVIVNNKLHGEGELYYNDELVLKGKFEDGVLVKGYAKYLKIYNYLNKYYTTFYTGDIVNDKLHGTGTIVGMDGNSLKGEFENGVLVKGEAKNWVINDKYYYGEIKNDKPHNKGYFKCGEINIHVEHSEGVLTNIINTEIKTNEANENNKANETDKNKKKYYSEPILNLV